MKPPSRPVSLKPPQELLIGPPIVVVETPTRASHGKRKSSGSVIQYLALDAEDDISEDDEDSQPVLESPFTQ